MVIKAQCATQEFWTNFAGTQDDQNSHGFGHVRIKMML
jgi:hypothetical protein